MPLSAAFQLWQLEASLKYKVDSYQAQAIVAGSVRGRLTKWDGFIPGELSFAANSRELERTRANSGELRANSPAVRRHPHSGELRRTFAGVRRTFAVVRRSSLGFARVRAYSAANWRTVRQKIRSPEEISTSVRRERDPPRTWFAANDNFGELVRQKLLENADYSSLSRTSSPPANCCSPRTTVRRELMFAGGELMFVGHRKPNLKSYRENGQTAPAAEEPLKSRLRTV